LDIPVPEIGLQTARIIALVGELVAAAVTQHVRVNAEWHSSPLAAAAFSSNNPLIEKGL
jgi:hypothetical protein